MAISLLGIIIIQYTWIRKTIDEKQAIIDNNLYSAVKNIDEKLNDYQTISFFDNTIVDNILNADVHISNISDSINHKITIINNLKEDASFEYYSDDTCDKPEIRIVSKIGDIENVENEILNLERELVFLDEELEGLEHIEFIENLEELENYEQNEMIFSEGFGDKVRDSLVIVEYANEIDKAKHVYHKIRLELFDSKDHRFDSLLFSQYLKEEFTAHNLSLPNAWGVYDTESNDYLIKPSSTNDMGYKIALFTTDILHPGQYEIHLNLNQNELIWREIWRMLLLSLLFLLIMAFVFTFSIRLAIKYKNISQIKSDFINNMTHEFKTPLASISLASDSILHPNTKFEPEAVKRYVKIIQDEKTKLNQHVERILEVASLNKDALNIPLKQININEPINFSINKLGLLIEKEESKVTFDNDEFYQAIGNSEHFENVMVNLIENAIKYSIKPANVSIKIKEDTSLIQISISDTGIGMNKNQVHKAFDNFYRAETGNIHNTKGFGLGLSYCKLVIEKMGGTISVSSELNSGTTVTIQLKKT